MNDVTHSFPSPRPCVITLVTCIRNIIKDNSDNDDAAAAAADKIKFLLLLLLTKLIAMINQYIYLGGNNLLTVMHSVINKEKQFHHCYKCDCYCYVMVQLIGRY